VARGLARQKRRVRAGNSGLPQRAPKQGGIGTPDATKILMIFIKFFGLDALPGKHRPIFAFPPPKKP